MPLFSVLRGSFRPAYGKIGVLSNLFLAVPVLVLTGNATRATKSGIIDSLGSLIQLLLNQTQTGQTYTMRLVFTPIEEMGNLNQFYNPLLLN